MRAAQPPRLWCARRFAPCWLLRRPDRTRRWMPTGEARPISEVIADVMRKIHLPRNWQSRQDGESEHDHYIYG